MESERGGTSGAQESVSLSKSVIWLVTSGARIVDISMLTASAALMMPSRSLSLMFLSRTMRVKSFSAGQGIQCERLTRNSNVLSRVAGRSDSFVHHLPMPGELLGGTSSRVYSYMNVISRRDGE